MKRFTQIIILLALAVGLSACQTDTNSSIDQLSPAKAQLLAYHDSGAYERDLATAGGEAQDYIEHYSGKAAKPALVLDIDETSLSNWPGLSARDYHHVIDSPCPVMPQKTCHGDACQVNGCDPVVAPTLKVYRAALIKHIAVFFITGRFENMRAATERNLHEAGYSTWVKLIMRPAGTKTPSAADYKAPERAKIEAEGYTIIANIGDQDSDLAGGHAERTFKLPDPFYLIP